MKQLNLKWNKQNGKPDKIMEIIMAVLLVVSMLYIAREAAGLVTLSNQTKQNGVTVLIDAGHGAADSGKIGINGSLEKEINLKIALRVKDLLEKQNIKVYMTREDDKGLYPESGKNKKIQDMRKRVELINKIKPNLTVSIHQNSFEQEKIKGAQVFYFNGSTEGKVAAEVMQEQMIDTLDKSNKRSAKSNTAYYLLKKTKSPIIIVECGFLSNYEEAEKLITKQYQEKVAWAIHLGILKYLNQNNVTGSMKVVSKTKLS